MSTTPNCNPVNCSVCHTVIDATSKYTSVSTPLYFVAGSGSTFDTVKLKIKQFRDNFGNTAAALPADRTDLSVVTAGDWNALATYMNTTINYKKLDCSVKKYSCSCNNNWLCSQCGTYCNPHVVTYSALNGKTMATTSADEITITKDINTEIIAKLNQTKYCTTFEVTCTTYLCSYCPSDCGCDGDSCGSGD